MKSKVSVDEPLADVPLTAEEMVFVRAEVASLRDAQRYGIRLLASENVASRLLATLDAERANTCRHDAD